MNELVKILNDQLKDQLKEKDNQIKYQLREINVRSLYSWRYKKFYKQTNNKC